MKFRQYVGENKSREIIKKVEKNTFKKEEKVTETFLGFGLGKQNLKRIFDYIKSWFIRYHVPFEAINPYLTLYRLKNLNDSEFLIKKIKKNKDSIIYKPEGTISIANNNRYDYILLNYNRNGYNDFIENVLDDMGVEILFDKCYVKLFKIKSNIIKPIMYNDMMYSAPKFPTLKLGNVSLLRSK